jgi:hypothetical protein
MSDLRRGISFRNLVLLAISTAAPGLLCAQGSVVGMPEHARAKASGTGWECQPGYKKVTEACVAIALPANAFLTAAYGEGWECMRGYRTSAKSCIAIELPPHAYLEAGGDRWKCERGYRNVAERCDLIEVPAHGYLGAAGDRWECDRGYRDSGEAASRSTCRRTAT